MADKGNSVFHLTTHRLEALCDGIFAIAMTLLVLNLTLPSGAADLSNIELHSLIVGQGYKFFNYAISFMLLAIFWMAHHQQFHHIRKLDGALIWINVVILMFVALIPFSTDVVGDFAGHLLADVLFAGNLLVLSLLFLANWVYATYKHRLVDADFDDRIIRRGINRNILNSGVSLLVIIVALFFPTYCFWLYLLIPILSWLRPFRNR
jgi:uncharacterized membrane protein